MENERRLKCREGWHKKVFKVAGDENTELHLEYTSNAGGRCPLVPLRTTPTGVQLIMNALLIQTEVFKNTIKELESENERLRDDLTESRSERNILAADIKKKIANTPKVLKMRVGKGAAGGGSGGGSAGQGGAGVRTDRFKISKPPTKKKPSKKKKKK